MIGDPVRHSLSPVLHNAAFRAAGLDWVYVAFPVAAGASAGADAVAAMRTFGIDGLSVTMPHKAVVAAAVDRLDETSATLGVVNTVWRDAGQLVGANTDGDGFVRSLAAEHDFEVAGRRCVLLGAGGAARSVAVALARAGAAEVAVVARSPERAAAVVALAGGIGRLGTVEDDIPAADLVVNATPAGMHGTPAADEVPFGIDRSMLRPSQVVADLVYAPPVTPLLTLAQEAGGLAVNGLGMLVHQAARQFELWTGAAAPLEAMRAALTAHLSR